MGNQFLSSLEVMTSRSQCPTVLLDAETVRLPFTPAFILQRVCVCASCMACHVIMCVCVCTVVAVMYVVSCLAVVAGLLWPVGDSEV